MTNPKKYSTWVGHKNDISRKMSNLLFKRDIDNLKHRVFDKVLIQIDSDKRSC